MKFIVLALFVSQSVFAGSFRLQKLNETNVSGHPESAISDGKYIFVSNLGKTADENDRDGYVSLLDMKGNLLKNNILPANITLNNPTGMVIHGGYLFVVDSSRIFAMPMSQRGAPFFIDLSASGTTRLNDPTAVAPGFLLVTEASQKKIYLIDIKKKSHAALKYDSRLGHPNGIDYDPKTGMLFVVANRVNDITNDPQNAAILAFQYSARSEGQLRFLWAKRHGYFLDGIDYLPESGNVLVFGLGELYKTRSTLHIQLEKHEYPANDESRFNWICRFLVYEERITDGAGSHEGKIFPLSINGK